MGGYATMGDVPRIVREIIGGDTLVATIVAGANVTVDDTDPAHPIVSATGGGGGGSYVVNSEVSDPEHTAMVLYTATIAIAMADFSAGVQITPGSLGFIAGGNLYTIDSAGVDFAAAPSVGVPDTGADSDNQSAANTKTVRLIAGNTKTEIAALTSGSTAADIVAALQA